MMLKTVENLERLATNPHWEDKKQNMMFSIEENLDSEKQEHVSDED